MAAQTASPFILKSNLRISFLPRFKSLSFHTVWVRIGGWEEYRGGRAMNWGRLIRCTLAGIGAAFLAVAAVYLATWLVVFG